jgi:DNA replication protein DnaC
VLQSLKYDSMNERRNMITESYSDTFNWIFNAEDEAERHAYGPKRWDSFSDWLKSENRVYWISGKPGSGKSIFRKFSRGEF